MLIYNKPTVVYIMCALFFGAQLGTLDNAETWLLVVSL